VPVRVHPLFWVVTVVLGLNHKGGTPPGELVAWVAVAFVSILVHELGHAVAQRWFGGRPWITLHGLGGLASCDDCDQSPRSQILISLAGPAAGFLLAAVLIAAVRLTGHVVGFAWSGDVPWDELDITSARGVAILRGLLYWEPLSSGGANMILHNMLFVNILWGLVNLLPVYPLDGGRIAREALSIGHPRRGIIRSLKLSALTAGIMALVGLLMWESIFTALMFAYLAYVNYQTLVAYQNPRW
jgi:Zn-dependent protease